MLATLEYRHHGAVGVIVKPFATRSACQIWFLLVAFATLLPVRAAFAQETSFGFGYVANAPRQMAGGAVFVVLPVARGTGLYVDAKIDPSSPARRSNYESSLSAADVENTLGDLFLDSEHSWRTINVAVLKRLNPALHMYAGVGHATKKKYNEYEDPDLERGRFGHYWVEDKAALENQLNLLAGAFFRLSSVLNTQFGVETAPRGVTVGVNVMLPRP